MTKQQKDYIIYVNDHSGSMSRLASAAMKDYNANITATKDAASKYEHDTVVSVIGVGYPRDNDVTRQVVVSNPHVLKPVTDWPVKGGTPLWDGIAAAIELAKSLPDINESHVSVLIQVTTDGQEEHSTKFSRWSGGTERLRELIAEVTATGRYTFVFRVPKGGRSRIEPLGVPYDNIQEWETTVEGMAKSTAVQAAATTTYFAARSAGARSSNTFYTDTSAVNKSKLKEVDPKEFSLYVVPDYSNGIAVRDFILERRTEFLVGAVYYQLSKSEARVSPSAEILLREVATGKVYEGAEVRKMLGLDTFNNARVHPNHGGGKYDVFIQSSSLNRKLVGNHGVIYRPSKGRPVTQADIDKYLGPKAKAAAPAAPPVVQLPSAPATGRPTPSPAAAPKKAVTGPTIQGRPVKFFDKRDDAREYARVNNLPKGSVGDAYKLYPASTVADDARWFVYL